jgi:hypothetical protein
MVSIFYRCLANVNSKASFLCAYLIKYLTMKTWDRAVGIATDYGLDDRGGRSSSPGRVKNFLFSTSSTPALGSTQPPTHDSVLGVKAAGA